MLVLGAQQSNPAIHIHVSILLQTPLPYRLLNFLIFIWQYQQLCRWCVVVSSCPFTLSCYQMVTICPHLPIWIEELTSLLIQNINDFCLNWPGFKAKAFLLFLYQNGFSIKEITITWVFMVAQTVKNPPAMRETWVWSLGWKDSWRKNGYPLQYSCLENPMGRGAWWATVHGVAKNQTWIWFLY